MGEFDLIQTYFQTLSQPRADVLMGIGDDAACLQVPAHHSLLVSTDTLVADVHFLSTWDAYDIAYKAVMVNLSDMAAMAATPCWLTLALTLPAVNESWLTRFAAGLADALNGYQVALVGGDTTRGPLSMTLTIHGLAPVGSAIYRHKAQVGDKIYVSGCLGGAALAVALETRPCLLKAALTSTEYTAIRQKLTAPKARVDLVPYLRQYATAAIDLSDGLMGDLAHICQASQVGAHIELAKIPLHSALHRTHMPYYFALQGGDDYELCFTVSAQNEAQFLQDITQNGLTCYPIGSIDAQSGLRLQLQNKIVAEWVGGGYQHF